MPDDGTLDDEPMSGRETVATVLELLRANYVFPEVADRAATAVEARLAAGEYDDLDEGTLAAQLTSHLNEICDDKHLRIRVGGGPGPRPDAPGHRIGRAKPFGVDFPPVRTIFPDVADPDRATPLRGSPPAAARP